MSALLTPLNTTQLQQLFQRVFDIARRPDPPDEKQLLLNLFENHIQDIRPDPRPDHQHRLLTAVHFDDLLFHTGEVLSRHREAGLFSGFLKPKRFRETLSLRAHIQAILDPLLSVLAARAPRKSLENLRADILIHAHVPPLVVRNIPHIPVFNIPDLAIDFGALVQLHFPPTTLNLAALVPPHAPPVQQASTVFRRHRDAARNPHTPESSKTTGHGSSAGG